MPIKPPQTTTGLRPVVSELNRWAQKTMSRFLLILFSLCGFIHGAEPKPLLVVLAQNPWLMVIGSDSPTFALYDDGTVICPREKPTLEDPFQTRKVSDAKRKAEELLSFDVGKMKDFYELTAWTDQVTTVIWTPTKKIVIYGDWRKPHEIGHGTDRSLKDIDDRDRKMFESLPAEIRDALLRIDRERSVAGTRWFPTTIEVMLWPYEYAPDASIIWPKDWPGLGAKDTQKRGEDSFSVFLPSEKLSELRKLLDTRKARGAVLIDGKKMAESHRFPFPGEKAWMR